MTSTGTPSEGSPEELEPVPFANSDDEFLNEADANSEGEDFYEDDEYYDDEDGEYDEDFEDDDFDDEYEDEAGSSSSKKKKKSRRRIKMHCFNCNRQEGHYLAHRGQWFFSYFQGLTFGIANLIGPFKCQCCGHNRLMCADIINPRKWFLPKGKKAATRKSKRSRSR